MVVVTGRATSHCLGYWAAAHEALILKLWIMCFACWAIVAIGWALVVFDV